MQKGLTFFQAENEFYKYLPILIPILAAITAGLMIWFGTFIADRRKLSTEKRTNLRTAYVNWFTNERIVKSQIEEVLSLVSTNLDMEEIELSIQEIKNLLDSLKELLKSSYEIILLETNTSRRTEIIDITNHLKDVRTLIFRNQYQSKRLLSSATSFIDINEKNNQTFNNLAILQNQIVDYHLKLKDEPKMLPEVKKLKEKIEKDIESVRVNLIKDMNKNQATLKKIEKLAKSHSKDWIQFQSNMLLIINSVHEKAESLLKDLDGEL